MQGQCLQALGRQLEALHSFRRAALRRAVPAPSKVRLTALRAASEIAEILGLTASVELYRQALSRAEQESSENGQDKNVSLAPLNLPRAPRNPPPVAGNSEN